MEIKTKLSIGEPMYIIEKTEYYKKISCVSCEGTGQITLTSGNQHVCPDCNGAGYLEKAAPKAWYVLDDRHPDSAFSMFGKPVEKINIEVVKDGRKKAADIKISYHPKGFGNYFYEENVFGTIDEAQAECNKRNLELSNNG